MADWHFVDMREMYMNQSFVEDERNTCVSRRRDIDDPRNLSRRSQRSGDGSPVQRASSRVPRCVHCDRPAIPGENACYSCASVR